MEWWLLRFVFKFLAFFPMLNQSLTKLDTRLVKIISKKSQLPPSIELTNFYDSILSLHENIRIHLRHQEWDSKCKTSHNQSQ